jgi:hypothetical protein
MQSEHHVAGASLLQAAVMMPQLQWLLMVHVVVCLG